MSLVSHRQAAVLISTEAAGIGSYLIIAVVQIHALPKGYFSFSEQVFQQERPGELQDPVKKRLRSQREGGSTTSSSIYYLHFVYRVKM